MITEQTELFTLADRTSLLIGVTAVRQDDLTAHKLARYLGILNETTRLSYPVFDLPSFYLKFINAWYVKNETRSTYGFSPVRIIVGHETRSILRRNEESSLIDSPISLRH